MLFPILASFSGPALAEPPWQREIVYQIFERSFYDSNGDRVGDFRGIAKKIPYLKRLGVTAVLLQPIFKSSFYHNYFADSFFEADSSLGGNPQFFAMVRRLHRAHLKAILDMEPQYVAEGHPWYKADSRLGLIAKKGVFGFAKLPCYDGRQIGVAMVNLMNPSVKRDLGRVFRFWAAPHGDLNSGVDGFRIDHMMDDLDSAHIDIHLLAGFWAPLERQVRAMKPGVFFVAEQANWASFGDELFSKGKVDAVYSIPLRSAFIDSVAKGVVEPALVQAVNHASPVSGTQLLMIEDHDVSRYASVVKSDPALLRLGAAFQFALRGTPSVYYGQELGMRGVQLNGHDDGNDIPVRLAYRWKSSLTAKGQAGWYGNGPWNNPVFSADHDGVSVEEEEGLPGSLLNFYRRLIRLRRAESALTMGSQATLASGNPAVLALVRTYGGRRILALFNFGDKRVSLKAPFPAVGRDLLTGRVVSGGLGPRGFCFVRL